jgi:hypothetical protein
MYFSCCSIYFCVVLCIVCFVSFSELFVCICVLYYCLRVATQLQLNISYHISYHIMSYHTISYIIPYHIIPYNIIYHTISYHTRSQPEADSYSRNMLLMITTELCLDLIYIYLLITRQKPFGVSQNLRVKKKLHEEGPVESRKAGNISETV